MYFTSCQNIPVIDRDFLLFGEIAIFRVKRISGNSEIRFCDFFVFRGEKVVCKSTDSKWTKYSCDWKRIFCYMENFLFFH